MSQAVVAILRRVEIFKDLGDPELAQIAQVCKGGKVKKGHVIFREDSDGDELYVVIDGAVEIQVGARGSDGSFRQSTINTLYEGQSFGEMALLGGGSRSASAIASATPTTLLIVSGKDFAQLCEQNTLIGYRVMRNLINDLTYKLRSSSLLLRGHIKWQDGQLSQL